MSSLTKCLSIPLILFCLESHGQERIDSLKDKQIEAIALFKNYQFQEALPTLKLLAKSFRNRTVWQNYFECKYYINLSYAILDRNPQQMLDSLNKDLALAYNTMGEKSSGAGEMFFALGWLHDGPLQKDEESLKYYKKAVDAFETSLGMYHPKTAKALSNYSKILVALDRYHIAGEVLQKALKVYSKVYNEEDAEWARLYNAAFQYYLNLGLYDEALKYAKAQYDFALLGNVNKKLQSSACRSLFLCYFQLNEYEKAKNYALEELQMDDEITSEEDKIAIYNNLGRIYERLAHDEKAEEYTQKAWEAKQRVYGKEHPLTVSSAINYGNYLIGTKRPEAGLKILDAQIDYLKPENRLRLSAIKTVAYKEKNDWQEAIVQYQLTKNQYLKNEMSDKLSAFAFYGLAVVATIESCIALGDTESLELGIAIYSHADSIATHLWSTLENYNNQRAFLNRATDIQLIGSKLFYTLFSKKKEIKYADQFLYTTEKSKSAISFSTMQLAERMNKLQVPKDVLSLKGTLNQQILQLQNQQPKSNIELIKKVNQRDSLHQLIRRQYPTYYSERIETKYATTSMLQEHLDNQSAYLIYINGNGVLSDSSEVYTLFITKKDVEIWSTSTKGLSKLLKEYLADIQHKKERLSNERELYGILSLSQVANYDQIKKLNIVPSNELFYLPFDMLTDENGQYLLEEYTIRYSQSTSIDELIKQRDVAEIKVSTLLSPSLENPAVEQNVISRKDHLAKLANAEKEIIQIEKLIGGENMSRVSKDKILEQFKKSDLIHLATHAQVNLNSPGRSAIYLSEHEDSVMYAYELYDQKFNAELVTLSACNTGVGKLQSGEGLQSLGKAFLYAGCPNLIISHWEVSDVSTAELMGYLYENLKEGMDKDEALREAKIAYLTNADPVKAHPYYWAGFTFTGDPKPLKFRSKFKQWWILIVPVLLLIFISRRKRVQS